MTENLQPPKLSFPFKPDTLAEMIKELYNAGHASITIIFRPQFQLVLGDKVINDTRIYDATEEYSTSSRYTSSQKQKAKESTAAPVTQREVNDLISAIMDLKKDLSGSRMPSSNRSDGTGSDILNNVIHPNMTSSPARSSSVASPLPNPQQESASNSRQRFYPPRTYPPMPFLVDDDYYDLCRLLRNAAKGTATPLTFRAITNPEDIRGRLNKEFGISRNRKATFRSRLKAAIRLGELQLYLKNNPKIMSVQQSRDALRCPWEEAEKHIQYATQTYILFQDLGQEAYAKLEENTLSFLENLSPSELTIVMDFAKGVASGKYNLPDGMIDMEDSDKDDEF
ncbi:9431_t:CDS:1 [Paraglomus occultum]|uniref:9431_t:CDS:1 n=1 Tax=Paraglomus occultum TaxID=144539 RepID=A0A9N8ZXR9_9GLOM|nr:9431_t:CDS:1 [Paraglomus occultum]